MKHITCDHRFGACKNIPVAVVKMVDMPSQLLLCKLHAQTYVLDKDYVVYTISIDEGIDVKKLEVSLERVD